MRRTYSRYTGDDLEGLTLEDLLSRLSDLLLSSGFEDPHWAESDDSLDARTLEALRDAIVEALLNGGLLADETIQRLLGDADRADGRSSLDDLVDEIIRRLTSEGYITTGPALDAERARRGGPGRGDREPERPPRFEVTDKGLDFLGYRTLRDLLGSLGRSSFGRHDTRDLATGIESSGAPKPYAFGDTLNLDPSSTLLNAVRRAGGGPAAPGGGAPVVDVQYEDLMVAQSEYQSSCATVLMLDCSHSMILYGEDRFTPAKRVALALATLIRTQYPGDALNLVLFHDSAEEIPLSRLARARVGPYYTNTREGLRLSRRLLERQRKDMRQIVMITDGKPSALTQPDGRIYRNAFGLDPFIVSETFAEVDRCRRAGILINTFMLARDPDLVSFVRRVSAICRGKAYFTTPSTLGQYVLLDYLNRKTRTVH
jgi:Ca-activated chloride channel family protein